MPAHNYVLVEGDLGYLVLGIVFVAIGLVTFSLTVLRTASRMSTVYFFGAMSCTWGVRFLLYTQLVPMMLAGNPAALQSTARGFTYAGAAAAFGFTWAHFGRGWRDSLRAMFFISFAFAVVACIALAAVPNRDLLLPVFNVMILAGAVIVVANMLHPQLREKARRQGLLMGFSIAVLFFVLENLRALGLPIPFDVEWIGVLVLYLTLGRLIAVQMFANERELASLSQELETARQIQTSLLPREAPRIAGVSTTARYSPMTNVAGDIYDFYRIDDHRQGIMVADVSGHGVPAAIIASMVKGAFRAQLEHLHAPERVLAGMNRILTGQLDQTFVTASCAFVDLDLGVLRYAGAGHPPLLILPQGQSECVFVEENGLILGQFADAEYRSVERPLSAGDRLMFYTDGIHEATNTNGDLFGEGSLHDFITRHRDLPAETFADELLLAVANWSGTNGSESQEDDLTLVVVDIHP